uniref:Uncharacterized protein n=1 Tax=Magallana gigas TaxID=29159 RepID=K1QU09_MAGGI
MSHIYYKATIMWQKYTMKHLLLLLREFWDQAVSVFTSVFMETMLPHCSTITTISKASYRFSHDGSSFFVTRVNKGQAVGKGQLGTAQEKCASIKQDNCSCNLVIGKKTHCKVSVLNSRNESFLNNGNTAQLPVGESSLIEAKHLEEPLHLMYGRNL